MTGEPDAQDAERDDTLCAEHRDGKPGGGGVVKAVLVIELDLPDDHPEPLMEAARSVGISTVPHAVGIHAAIREDCARVLDVFAPEETP